MYLLRGISCKAPRPGGPLPRVSAVAKLPSLRMAATMARRLLAGWTELTLWFRANRGLPPGRTARTKVCKTERIGCIIFGATVASIGAGSGAVAQSERRVKAKQPLPPPPVTGYGIHKDRDEREASAEMNLHRGTPVARTGFPATVRGKDRGRPRTPDRQR